MIDLLTDRSVVVSVSVAAVILVVVAAAHRVSGRPSIVPSWAVWIPAAAAALALSDVDLARYGRLPDDLAPWTLPVAAAGAAIAIGTSIVVTRSSPRDGEHRADLGLVLAAATIGVFGCIPETAVLRVLPGPVAIAAVAALVAVIRSFGTIDATVLAVTLAWIALVDGQTRPASIVGAAACLGAVGLISLYRPDEHTVPASRWLRPAVVAVAILAASRLAGTLESVPLATITAIGVLALATGAILANGSTADIRARVEVGRRPGAG